MILLLLKLFFYHIIADFLLQNEWMIRSKKQGNFVTAGAVSHIGIHALLLFLITWSESWSSVIIAGAIAILISHYLIDWLKIHLEKKENKRLLFFLDQIAHIIMLVLVAWLVSEKPMQSVSQPVINQLLLLATSLILVTQVSGVITGVLLSKWTDQGNDFDNSLANAGMHIGFLERFLIFVFIINSQWAAVGLLLTAKSIFRFSEIEKNRKLAEYFLIGTLISLTLSIIISLSYKTLKTIITML